MKHQQHHELHQHSFLVSLTSCHITKDAHNATIPATPTRTYDMHIIYIPTKFIILQLGVTQIYTFKVFYFNAARQDNLY